MTFLLSAAVSTICRVSAPCHPTGREQFCFARPSVGVLWIQRDVHARQTLGSRASKAPSCLGDIETFCRGVVSGERSANALFVQLSPLFVSAARPPRLFWAAFCSDSPGFCYFSVWARCAQSDFLRLLIIIYMEGSFELSMIEKPVSLFLAFLPFFFSAVILVLSSYAD